MDLRIKRTKKLIFDAFIKLVSEKGYEAITIQEIADEAMINRATFYAHYKDKQDLYETILQTIIQTFTSVLDEEPVFFNKKLHVKKVELLLAKFYKDIRHKHSKTYSLFEGNNEILQIKFSQILREKYEMLFESLKITESDLEVPVDFIIKYMSAIFTSTLRWWMNADHEMTPIQMAQLVVKLIANGHLTVLGIDVERS